MPTMRKTKNQALHALSRKGRTGGGTYGPEYRQRPSLVEALTGGVGDLSWQDQAQCKGSEGLNFCHPGNFGMVMKCKTVCRDCPVKDECLEFALATEDYVAVMGGTSGPERRKMHRAES